MARRSDNIFSPQALFFGALLPLAALNSCSLNRPAPSAENHSDAGIKGFTSRRAALSPAPAINTLIGDESKLDPTNAKSGCRSSQPLGASLAEIVRNVNHPEERNQDSTSFSDTLLDWMFGSGLGRTAINVGTVALFPPYAFYLIGNAGIALAGYDPLYVTDALPDAAKNSVLGAYNEVTSIPGRLNAAVLREDFCQPLPPAPLLVPPAPVVIQNQPTETTSTDLITAGSR